MPINIVSELRAQNHGGRLAFSTREQEYSFDDLFALVSGARERLEREVSLSDQGVVRIGVKIPDGILYIAVALAVLEAGACFVPMAGELSGQEEKELRHETALQVVISLPEEKGEVADLRFELLEDATPSFPVSEFESLNPAFIRFSSGTTGKSKGVVLSHESLLARVQAAGKGLGLEAGDRVLWTLPMAHHFVVTLILYLRTGATTVFVGSTDAEQVYQRAQEEQITVLYSCPLSFSQLAQLPEAAAIPSLRLALSTAAPLSAEVAKAFRERFKIPLTQALGIIEVGLPIVNLRHAREHPTALGEVLPDYEIQVGEDGTASEGELRVRGAGLFDAYLHPWQRHHKEDFFATGDLVRRVEGETWTLCGRSKTVINVGGLKVFPEEVEGALGGHPAIEEVQVYGRAHPVLGEFPAARVVLVADATVPTVGEFRDFLEEKLASHKLPLTIEKVAQLPRTASGKIKRH